MPSKLDLIIRVYFCLLGWPMCSIHVGAIMASEFCRDVATMGYIYGCREVYFKELAHDCELASLQSTGKSADSARILFFFYLFLFWPYHTACGILVPWPGIEPVCAPCPCSGMRSLNHWTASGVPQTRVLHRILEAESLLLWETAFFYHKTFKGLGESQPPGV